MIPIELQNQKEEFVKNYMENIDKRFIRNMYVFKFIQKGKGVFAEIMAITRIYLIKINSYISAHKDPDHSQTDLFLLQGNSLRLLVYIPHS